MDGLTAMKLFRQHMGDAPIIVMTAFGDLNVALRTLENGAFEYIVKPFDLAEIRAAIERALRGSESGLSTHKRIEPNAGEMLGNTPAMHEVFKRIALAAKSNSSVLIRGEDGVGKETAARAIHRHSSHSKGPFVAFSVAAFSPEQAESELFGDGTGGSPTRSGLLEQASGGTLFLDEIADAPLSLQVKLLRALEQCKVFPVGADKPVPIHVRIISTTTSDLRERIRSGAFRHDLYLHIATYEISIPPLRERREEIAVLAQYFAAQATLGAAEFADETLAEMTQRPWYGNVRELQSAVAHAFVVTRRGAVLPSHLPPPLLPAIAAAAAGQRESPMVLEEAVTALTNSLLEDPANAGDVYARFLKEVEPPLLATALLRHGSRCAPAARALGMHRTTLRRKLTQYGIDERPA